MLTRKLLIVLILSFCILPGACSSAAAVAVPTNALADMSFDGKEAEVAEGGTLTVTLECDTRIGMEWSLKSITDENILQLTGQKFKPLEDGTGESTNGHEVWSFQALSKGEAAIIMEYRQPWQTQFPPEDTFTLNVLVR